MRGKTLSCPRRANLKKKASRQKTQIPGIREKQQREKDIYQFGGVGFLDTGGEGKKKLREREA